MIEIIGGALIAMGIVLLLVLRPHRPKRESALKIVAPPPLPPSDAAPELNVLDELERLGQDGRAQAERDEKMRKWLRPFGVFGRLVSYAILFLLLYAYWPSDISHTPFASLTLSDVFGTVAAMGIAFVLIRALFEPSDDEGIKDAWGWLGVLIAGAAVIAVTISLRH